MNRQEIFERIGGKLIVSCQALENEPLHSSCIMARMALAARLGGAAGIRANTGDDIRAIRGAENLPVIGIVKKDYPDSDIYITPTMADVEEVASAGAEIIAMDATSRIRPGRIALDTFYYEVRAKYPDCLLMADISTLEEGKHAFKLGFDLVGTTLCSYTSYTKGTDIPAFSLIRELSSLPGCKVIAEGGIHTPEQLKQVFLEGAFSAVIGGAITRPQEITKRFVEAI